MFNPYPPMLISHPIMIRGGRQLHEGFKTVGIFFKRHISPLEHAQNRTIPFFNVFHPWMTFSKLLGSEKCQR